LIRKLSVGVSGWVTIWEQTMRHDSTHDRPAVSSDSSNLLTALVVAPKIEIPSFVGRAIGLSPDDDWRLQIQPNTLSVLHYPSKQQRSILQTLNLA
jgi:hypothetical protein